MKIISPADNQMKFYTVSEAKEMLLPDGVTEFIPQVYHKYVPDVCDACGRPMVVNRGRTIMRCSNPLCIKRISMIVVKCLSKLSINGMGPATVFNHMMDNNQKFITDFLRDPPMQFRVQVREALQKKTTFSAAVSSLCIPQLQERSHVIFEGVSSYEEFLNKAAAWGGVPQYLAHKFGGSGVLVGTLQQQLFAYRNDLHAVSELFNIRSDSLLEIPVVITGGVKCVVDENKRPYTKLEFIDALNALLEPQGKVLRLQQHVTKATRILISDSNEQTGNYATAMGYINAAQSMNQEPSIVIVSSDMLLNQIIEDGERLKASDKEDTVTE